MKKLLLALVFLAGAAQAQNNICIDPLTGYTKAPECTATNELEVAVQSIIPGTSATSLGKAEDAAHTSGDTGVMALGWIGDGSAVAASLDYAPFNLTSKGALNVVIDTNYQTAASGILKAEDSATASGHNGVGILGVVQTAPNAGGSTTAGDYTFPNLDSATGGWYTNPVGNTARVCAAITPDTNAFAANDIVGPAAGASGLLTFASALRAVMLSGILQSIEVTNTEIDGIAFDFCLFTADPSGSTVAANGALTLVAADLQKLVGCFPVADGRAFATTEAYQAQGVNMSVKAAATSVFGLLRTTGAPTWAAAQTVNVCLTFVQD
jgi:hypothetical protein